MARTTHVLEQLDAARRTAVCAVHGPVRIRRRMRLGAWHCELELREAREAKRWQRNAGAERLARALNRSPGPDVPSTGTNHFLQGGAGVELGAGQVEHVLGPINYPIGAEDLPMPADLATHQRVTGFHRLKCQLGPSG